MRPFIERLVTYSKKGTLADRRRIMKILGKRYSQRMVEKIGPKYKDRSGGYTRIIKVGRRAGDGNQRAIIEFV